MTSFGYNTYLSPFTWRYGSKEMRKIWSEISKRKLWRRIWVALAKAQKEMGLVSEDELADLEAHQEDIDIQRAHEIEKETQHDLMAEIKTYAEQAKVGGGKIHLGATSMDIEDNADALRIRDSLLLIEKELKELLTAFSEKIDQYKDFPCMAYSHLQPAEPTTLGYRFAMYTQDLLLDLKFLHYLQKESKGKGMKGSVGNAASYVNLTGKEKAQALERAVMEDIGIGAATITTQVAPRKIEFLVGACLSSISQSLYKFSFDLRLMQSPGFGEWQEPFGEKQVGSSAMPFKRNPIKAEQICSLARLVFSLENVVRDNAAHMLLERTLDDSANRRIVLPEMFLAVDTILVSTKKIVQGMVIHERKIEKNLEKFGPFAATEIIMMEAVKKGADRQHIHEALRENSMKAKEQMGQTGENPLLKLLTEDSRVTEFIQKDSLKSLLDAKSHTGLASEKCAEFLEILRHELS